MTPVPPEEPTTESESIPRPSIGRPLDIHVMTPVPPEEPTTESESIPRPSIGRPLDIHVITQDSPTTGGVTDDPSDRQTPPSDGSPETTPGGPITTDSEEEVDVELNIPGVGSIDVDVGAGGVRINGDLENPTGENCSSHDSSLYFEN